MKIATQSKRCPKHLVKILINWANECHEGQVPQKTFRHNISTNNGTYLKDQKLYEEAMDTQFSRKILAYQLDQSILSKFGAGKIIKHRKCGPELDKMWYSR